MQAIIETGNQQFRVQEGDIIDVDLLNAESGQEVTFDQVKLVAKEGETKVGTPNVDGASVTGKVLDEVKGDKVLGISFRRRQGSKVTKGHRQRYNRVEITGIQA